MFLFALVVAPFASAQSEDPDWLEGLDIGLVSELTVEHQRLALLDEPEAARGLERWHPNAYVVPGDAPASVDPLSGAPTTTEVQNAAATEANQRKGMSRGGKIGLGVIVPLVAGIAIVGGVGAARLNNMF